MLNDAEGQDRREENRDKAQSKDWNCTDKHYGKNKGEKLSKSQSINNEMLNASFANIWFESVV